MMQAHRRNRLRGWDVSPLSIADVGGTGRGAQSVGSDVEQQFAAFYDASFGRTLACVYALTGDRGEAEDIAQEAYIRAWPRWRSLQTYDDPGAWVRQVACRVAVSRWRRARTALSHAARLRGRELQALPPSDDTLALVAALSQLPEAQRRALVLHHIGDLPVAEIARLESVAVGTVKARLSRGRAALAPQPSIENEYEETTHA